MTKNPDEGVDDPVTPVSQTMTNSPGSLQAARDLIINTGDTEETKERLREISETLKGFGEQYSREQLLKKYPLGYVVFDVDYKNSVFPYDQQLLDEYEIDWKVVNLKTTDTHYELRLPDFRRKKNGGALANITITGTKDASIYGNGAFIGNLAILGQVLAVKEGHMIFVVGFARLPC